MFIQIAGISENYEKSCENVLILSNGNLLLQLLSKNGLPFCGVRHLLI